MTNQYFTQGLETQEKLNSEVDLWSNKLQEFPRGEFGLTPDAIKATDEYKTAKSNYNNAFARLRNFNSVFTKVYKKELREYRLQKKVA